MWADYDFGSGSRWPVAVGIVIGSALTLARLMAAPPPSQISACMNGGTAQIRINEANQLCKQSETVTERSNAATEWNDRALKLPRFWWTLTPLATRADR